jgi:tetratricopeptide (TPR) repeat protein
LLEATLRIAPYYATTRIKLAELLLKMGLPDEARAQYEWRLTLVPNDPYARLGLARIASQAGDRAAAVKYLEAIVADHPDSPAARNLLSQIYADMGDAARAGEQRRLSGATGEWRDPEDPWMDGVYTWSFDPYHFNKIDKTPLQARRLEASLAFYNKAVRQSPGDGRLYDAIGQIELQLGRLDAAAATLESGLAAAPGTAALYSTLSQVRSLQGQAQAAIAALRRGIAAAPGASELRYDLGLALEAGGNRDEAVAEYRGAVRLDPRFAEAHWSLGLCLLAMARDSEAKASLGRAVELKPARGGDLATLAQGAIDAGRFATAECCLHVLVESCPGSPVRQLLERAATAARKGGDGRAAADFEQLLARPVW